MGRARRPDSKMAAKATARVTVVRPSTAVARRQGAWIAAIEPWHGLGYGGAGLARFLGRAAIAEQAWIARDGARGPVLGVVVLQRGVLLGNFVALLAVKPTAKGQGVGRALTAHVRALTFVERKWLYVSADAGNSDALAFYRKLEFRRVGRLPDLVRDGNTEILLRLGRGVTAAPSLRRRKS
jgi:ribosomal protein S18 acetylase RimI-like enzyme